MSKASYWQRGDALDYVNTTEEIIEAGTILVIGTKIGIAAAEIQPGAVGAVNVTGVYKMPSAGDAVQQGDAVYWDADSGAVCAGGSVNAPATLSEGDPPEGDPPGGDPPQGSSDKDAETEPGPLLAGFAAESAEEGAAEVAVKINA